MIQGFDTAVDTTQYARRLWDLGYRVAFRYHTRSEGDWRQLKQVERDILGGCGFWIGTYFQNHNDRRSYFSADNAKRDRDAGIARAEWLEQPKGSAIFYAVDTDVPPGTEGPIVDYFAIVSEGVSKAGYAMGAYGGSNVLWKLTETSRDWGDLVDHTVLSNAKAWRHGPAFDPDVTQHLPIWVLGRKLQVDPLDVKGTAEAGLWRP